METVTITTMIMTTSAVDKTSYVKTESLKGQDLEWRLVNIIIIIIINYSIRTDINHILCVFSKTSI